MARQAAGWHYRRPQLLLEPWASGAIDTQTRELVGAGARSGNRFDNTLP
ncbi:hypothetical protein MPLB_1250014 [Mesorhizobium sp. ORS 3324]|nr:hypothetical protein MPLB_1250014 [Mesorhizobium sp. ORS 3324]